MEYQRKKIRLFMKLYVRFCVILGITVGILFLLEGVARVWYWLRAPKSLSVVRKTKDEEQKRFMKGAPLELERLQWQPYVYFRRRPYKSASINVDGEGRRKTTNFTEAKSAKTRIFMFGGSTMWGTGVSDEQTIPSLLSQELRARGVPDFHITNFGETAYVNTQEMLSLIFELRRGNIPSMVIFYDGVNEVFSSCINNEAGYTQFESQISFLPLIERAIGSLSWFDLLLRDSALAKGMVNLGRKLFPYSPAENRKFEGSAGLGYEVDSLAEKTVEVYRKNLEMIQLLSAKYHFKVLYLWQPNIYGKPKLAAEEKQYLDSLSEFSREIGKVMVATDRYILENPPPIAHFHNLGGVLKRESRNLYRDSVHLVAEGNQIVQKAIAELLISDASISSEIL